MKISSGSVVSIDFKIMDAEGNLLDQSGEDNEWTFLIGSEEIPPGLESALIGKEAGDHVKVTLTPEIGYGERDEGLVTTISKEDLGDDDTPLAVGDQLEAETEDGFEIVTVIAITADEITVDANHEFAGKTVSFDVTIKEVREATDEEKEHGHVHFGECEEEEWEDWEEEFEDEEDEEEESK